MKVYCPIDARHTDSLKGKASGFRHTWSLFTHLIVAHALNTEEAAVKANGALNTAISEHVKASAPKSAEAEGDA